VKILVFRTAHRMAAAVAERVARALAGDPALVVGLPTGRTPVEAYAQLRRLHAAGHADFGRATTFNLDEFVGLDATHPGSFRAFLERHLLSGINLPRDRAHFLDGAAPDLEAECARYEAAIAAAGGIGLQLLGIGLNGHIGFNEPAAVLSARTHRVRLAESTRRENAALFGGDVTRVPREALSMGVGAILQASTILLMASGARKARCIERAVNGPVTTRLPASLLQLHRDVEIYVDVAAAVELDRSGRPLRRVAEPS
jgi:glucosamine-6-phosphate deaminase